MVSLSQQLVCHHPESRLLSHPMETIDTAARFESWQLTNGSEVIRNPKCLRLPILDTIPTQPQRHSIVLFLVTMASNTLPRTVIRAISRSRKTLRPNVAKQFATQESSMRCIHSSSGATILSASRYRPSSRQWGTQSPLQPAVVGRRTIFIQTEATPNPDVSIQYRLWLESQKLIQSLRFRRLNSSPTTLFFQRTFHLHFSSI